MRYTQLRLGPMLSTSISATRGRAGTSCGLSVGGVIPFQGFVGSAQTGSQFAVKSSNTAGLLPPSRTPVVDSDRTAASRLPDKMLPPGVSSAPQPAPFKDEQSLLGSNTGDILSPDLQPVPHASSVDNGDDSHASDSAFGANLPEASQGMNIHTAGMGTGGRSKNNNNTSPEGVDSTPSTMPEPRTHSPSVNTSDPASSAGLSGPHHNASPESPNPSPHATSLSPSVPAALSSPSAAHDAKPAVMFVNASSPAGPLPGTGSQSQLLYDPLASSPAVHASASLGLTSTHIPSDWIDTQQLTVALTK